MIVVLTTYPDLEMARSAARALVEKDLARCVNITRIEASLYKWEGRIRQGEEYLLMIKAPDEAYAGLESAIKEDHPYELPEIIRLEVSGGLPAYLRWVDG